MRIGRASSVTTHGDSDLLRPGLPMAVQVEFTSRCNLRCRMCPLTTGTSSSSGAPGPMTDVVFDELLAIARRCGRVVLAGYGEPLTNPQCLPMLRALNDEGITIEMATNGISLTPAIARQLVELEHLAHVTISVDSTDPDVYRDVRGGSLKRALDGVANLMAVIDNRDRVSVASVALHANLDSLLEFPALLAELGVRRYCVQAVHDYNDYSLDQRLLDHPEMARRFAQIEAACITYGIELDLTVPDRSHADLADSDRARARYYGRGEWDEQVTRQCHVPWEVPFVDKDGRVFPCCFAAAGNAGQVGQLGPQTFEEVWLGPEFRKFRRDIVDGRTTPAICRRCTLVPLGAHPFKTWVATIVSGTVNPSSRDSVTVSVSVRNDSERAWTPIDEVRIGTSAPRDSGSVLAHPGWLSPNRAATFAEREVAPGELATFEFAVARHPNTATGAFEVVADRACWLPNTRFEVRVAGRRSAWPAAARFRGSSFLGKPRNTPFPPATA